jgi:hypothetical protein
MAAVPSGDGPGVLPQRTIQAAFERIGSRVNAALRTQLGDVARLNSHRNECLRLMATVQQVKHFPIEYIDDLH